MSRVIRRIAVGAALAGAAGYVAGLLTAPKSGRATRQELTDNAGSSKREVEKQLKTMHTELGKLVEEAKGKGNNVQGKAEKELTSLVGKAKDSKNKVRELLSAVHDGEASDKDLKRAITDARHAIKHIKEFLHK